MNKVQQFEYFRKTLNEALRELKSFEDWPFPDGQIAFMRDNAEMRVKELLAVGATLIEGF